MKIKKFVIKDKPKKIALVYRIHSKEAVEMATKVTNWLLKKKVEVYTAPEQKKIPRTEMIVSSNDLKEMNLIVVLGGDGVVPPKEIKISQYAVL